MFRAENFERLVVLLLLDCGSCATRSWVNEMLAIKESEYSCPADLAVQFMSSKWTIQIVKELLDGPKRPCQLYKAMPGISSKVLNQRLKYLRSIGIISQHKQEGKTLFTQYRLTELGSKFEAALLELEKFGERILEASADSRSTREESIRRTSYSPNVSSEYSNSAFS